MNLVYARQTQPRVYDFYLGGLIGSGVNCNYLAEEMLYINKENAADRINIHINSEGGNVINGVALITAILTSKIPVYTINDGYAMSMAGYIWVSAKKENRCMVEFGALMLHAARYVDDNGDEIDWSTMDENEKGFLLIVRNQLETILSSCTGKNTKEVRKILSKDSFYTCEQCIDEGYMMEENVIRFGIKPDINSKLSITENMKRIAAFYNGNNDLTINNESSMKTVIARLGLNPDASEQSVLTAIESAFQARDKFEKDLVTVSKERDELKTEKEKISGELVAEKKKVTEFETAQAAQVKAQVEAYVDESIKKGTLKAENRIALIASATKDFEGFKATVESIQVKVVAPNVTAQLSTERGPAADKYGIEAKNLNFEYLERHDIEALAKIKASDPALFAALVQEYELKFSEIK